MISHQPTKKPLAFDGQGLLLSKGHTVVALVPVRTDARWFQDYCLGREIHFIRGRLKFGGSTSNAPFGCCVVVFRPSLKDVQWVMTETDFRKAESKEG
ncbi:hypothetical protein EXE08_14560 [Acinetobacter pittii]|nr:hypothetical protein EXE08_14560 [Acinetobacter pittii]